MDDILSHTNHLDICKDKPSAIHTYRKLVDITYTPAKKTWLSACPIPCKQTIYTTKIKNIHRNTVFELSQVYENVNVFYLLISYDSFVVEVSVETLVYDIGSFLAAVGGNLGLFLGFSCLSVLLGFIKFFEELRNYKIVMLNK